MSHDDGSVAKIRCCPHCQHSQLIDPSETRKPIQCKNTSCCESSSFASWCNPADSPQWVAIAEQTCEAFTANIAKHTVGFTVQQSGNAVGSATAIAIAGRLLLATAGHNLTVADNKVGLFGRKGPTFGDRSRWVITSLAHPLGMAVDVGVIELLPSAADELGFEPLPIERAHDAYAGLPVLKTRVIGYPYDWYVHEYGRPDVGGYRALSYGCETLPADAWHDMYAENLDDTINLMAHYETGDSVEWSDGVPISVESTPRPGGMSGGGWWQRSRWLEDDAMWKPDDLRLIGIQSTFLKERSLIKGVQIIHWLRLVADTYSDLEAELLARFPRLSTV